MGFFRKLFSAEDPNVLLAEQLLQRLTLGGVVEPKYKSKVDEICSRLSRFGEIAAYASELCGEPTTPRGYCVKAKACEWAGAAYRQETIKWSLKWIEAGAFYKGLTNEPRAGTTEQNLRFSDAYQRLGKAYEGEHMFEQAMQCYQRALEAWPNGFHLYNLIAALLVKMNRLDDAIAYLEQAPIIEPETEYARNHRIEEIKKRKEKNYVYKPRKKTNCIEVEA